MIEELADKKSDVTGLATGFHDFDKLTSGPACRASSIIVAGRPAMGKTSFVLNIAENVPRSAARRVVAVFSLEMSKEELGIRLLSGVARIDAKRLQDRAASRDRDWQKLAQAADQLCESKIFIDDSRRSHGASTCARAAAACLRRERSST